MTPDEKKKVMDVVDCHNGKFMVDCLKQLNNDCSITWKDMQNFRVCYNAAKDDVSQLDKMLPSASAVPQDVIREVELAEKSVRNANDGLKSYLLKPSDF